MTLHNLNINKVLISNLKSHKWKGYNALRSKTTRIYSYDCKLTERIPGLHHWTPQSTPIPDKVHVVPYCQMTHATMKRKDHKRFSIPDHCPL